MNEQNLLDLEKLCDFVESKVPDQSFDFSSFMDLGRKNPLDAVAAGGGCGTTCCILGWTPAVFPEKVAWTHVSRMDSMGYRFSGMNPLTPDASFLSDICLLDDNATYDLMVGVDLFGLMLEEARYLFLPLSNYGNMGLTSPLESSATRHQVVAHIRDFVARKRQNPDWTVTA